jgi:hypothetical protein
VAEQASAPPGLSQRTGPQDTPCLASGTLTPVPATDSR